MKVLVTGAKGQLGFDVVQELMRCGISALGVDREEMDITDADAVDRVVKDSGADAVIHCAAYTAVDAAQENASLCQRVNRDGTKNIAMACLKYGKKMLYISTDYVFDGEGEKPWEPEDHANPVNVYGRTKYEGELAVRETLEAYFIVRVSWVFGLHGKNFVKTMLRLSGERECLHVVDDQFGSPTYTRDLAVLLAAMVQTDRYGVYHATNEGICSWYEFACEIFRQAGKVVQVEAVPSDAFPVRAKRPHNSRMDKGKLIKEGLFLLPRWEDALSRYLLELREAGEI
jgi:dTDP-4-dehydrorhamnose reductase